MGSRSKSCLPVELDEEKSHSSDDVYVPLAKKSKKAQKAAETMAENDTYDINLKLATIISVNPFKERKGSKVAGELWRTVVAR